MRIFICLLVGIVQFAQICNLVGQDLSALVVNVSDMGDGSISQARLEAQRQARSGGLPFRSFRRGQIRNFVGQYTPPELPEDKKDRFIYGLALFSDDGCNVTLKGSSVHARLGRGQHLPNLGQSFHVLPVALSPGETVDITINYRNTIYAILPGQPPDIDGLTLFLYLIPVAIAVDANRDGDIVFEGDSRDITSRDKPFRFWINDDHDGIPNDERDVVPPAESDYADGTIQTMRDLEDFARIHIRLDGLHEQVEDGTLKIGLKFSDASDESAAINVYKCTDADGSTAYLTDEEAALAQVSGQDAQAIGQVTSGDPLMLPPDFWTGSSEQNSTKYLLFEGSGEGKGQLVLTIHKADGTKIAEGGGCWLDIKDTKKMYARGNGSSPGYTSPYSQSSYMGMQTQNGSFDEIEFDSPFDEEDKVIVFVHGIHSPALTDPNQIKADWYATCETTFKRLWHHGYKGRFAAYKWAALTPGLPFKFNESEFRGWNFGNALSQFVNSIQRARKTLLAHSQGNVVCGEALRSGSLSVENYILLQAAVPGGCYDTRDNPINNYERFLVEETDRPTPDTTADLGYRGYLSSLGVSRRVVNFQNGIDYALVTGAIWGLDSNWEKNEVDYKPNVPVPYGWSTDGYIYNIQKNVGNRCELHKLSGFTRELSDIRESMGFVARPRSKPVGALGATRGSIQSDISLRGTPYNFTDDPKDHGGQWSRSIQRTWDFYSALLDVVSDE